MSKANQSIKMTDEILGVQHGFVSIPMENKVPEGGDYSDRMQSIGTVLANMAYFGYAPSREVAESLLQLDDTGLAAFWKKLKPALAYVSGDDRNMGNFVVYKNFPKEVLEMSQAEYWIKQILMYIGFQNEYFTQDEEAREPIIEKLSLKVLGKMNDNIYNEIFADLCKVKVSWNDFQKAQVEHLNKKISGLEINLDDFAFKENGILLIKEYFGQAVTGERSIRISNATDVLRLAAAVSDGDFSLRTNSRFRNFSRSERKFLLNIIENSNNIEDDFAMRPEQWKRLLSRLHPGDFKLKNVSQAYARLYTKTLETTDSVVEKGFVHGDKNALDALKRKPGQFMRRLHKAYDIFGSDAFDAFSSVIDKLDVSQLLKLDAYLKTINNRKSLLFTPKGSWVKTQIVENGKKTIESNDLNNIRGLISQEIGARLNALHPSGFDVDERTKDIKLQSSGQDLASYGRGTSFAIPDDMKFIRTASFWQYKTRGGSNWYDVGWNFFDENWKDKGTICWNSTSPHLSQSCVFSGDPTNSKDLKGRACQMIDLYPEKLVAEGVRYAVWSVLCFSQESFAEAEEVLATMQWGEEPQKGKKYEPARAQMVFPLTGKVMSKYVAYVDLIERKIVYLDVSLKVSVSSALQNVEVIENVMPAIVEHIEALPSIGDLFSHGKAGNIPVLRNDEAIEIDGPSYVFERLNTENIAQPINLEEILNAKGKSKDFDQGLDVDGMPKSVLQTMT